MSSPSIEFHKIWIDQCAATEDIRESFGPENAMDYLIGEKTSHVPDGVGKRSAVLCGDPGVR